MYRPIIYLTFAECVSRNISHYVRFIYFNPVASSSAAHLYKPMLIMYCTMSNVICSTEQLIWMLTKTTLPSNDAALWHWTNGWGTFCCCQRLPRTSVCKTTCVTSHSRCYDLFNNLIQWLSLLHQYVEICTHNNCIVLQASAIEIQYCLWDNSSSILTNEWWKW